MNAALSIVPSEQLSEKQRVALLKLLTDEDSSVYGAVRERIISQGPSAVTWLRPHKLSSEPVLRRRVLEVIQHFGKQAADTRFLSFCLKHGEELDLEAAAWLLAQTQYPDINIEGYRALLDDFASELRDRVDFTADSKEILSTINDYLFQELAFSGNEKNYYDAENSYLNRVLDRRTGNPINLCLLYILVARRLRLPVTGIGLPGHFICRHQSTAAEIYVDAFSGGKFLTKADCVQYLVHGNYSLRDDCLAAVSPRRMLLRICGNLHQIYLQQERAEESTRLQRYLVALAR
ncbi:MAG TPA: transglutaminase-like domain-containing protein [Candidatus Dormibacteraeota bacterium]|nr:transglutaminase-like domain-containing protein [Candidatus Dormibacteraeota bacterium]